MHGDISMTTKIKSLRFLTDLCLLRAVIWCLSSVVCFSAASAWAGDLTTDNLTVTKDATIMGNMYFSTTAGGTNGGGTATGGTITTNGNYRIHTFTNVGTANFIVPGGSLTCDVLVVAGGGWGGNQIGGGGGGGEVYYTNSVSLSGTNIVVIGEGGGEGCKGSNSIFANITALGGGKGGSHGWVPGEASTGSSGGGGDAQTYKTGAAGIPGKGFAGGNGGNGAYGYRGAGGGGAGSIGLSYTDARPNGGFGITNSISGVAKGYGGGGGGCDQGGDNQWGLGFDGGGDGNGNDDNPYATPGQNNTGGGGGGGYDNSSNCGKPGGSGIVIVRYPATTSSNVTTLAISSNGISQASASGVNVLMGKVGIGTNNPAEQLHVVGNARVDGTNIVSAITLGGETRTTWPTGNLSASNNLSDIADQAAARANLGLGSAATNEAGAFLSPNGDGSQITGITATQVGALSTNAGALIAANNLSDVANAGTARDNLGLGTAATNEANAFLSTAGGVVNGSLDITGSITAGAPAGDVPMGVYTNQ